MAVFTWLHCGSDHGVVQFANTHDGSIDKIENNGLVFAHHPGNQVSSFPTRHCTVHAFPGPHVCHRPMGIARGVRYTAAGMCVVERNTTAAKPLTRRLLASGQTCTGQDARLLGLQQFFR